MVFSDRITNSIWEWVSAFIDPIKCTGGTILLVRMPLSNGKDVGKVMSLTYEFHNVTDTKNSFFNISRVLHSDINPTEEALCLNQKRPTPSPQGQPFRTRIKSDSPPIKK